MELWRRVSPHPLRRCVSTVVTMLASKGLRPTVKAFAPATSTRPMTRRRLVLVCADTSKPVQVVVTGAGGRTGGFVFKKLLQRRSDFAPRGVVRSDKSAKQLKEWGANDDEILVGDILTSGSGLLDRAMEGADALVIATSAVPQIKPLSFIKVIWGKITKADPAPRPEFTFKGGQMPEQVDWEGQRLQIDAAKKAGVRKVVLVGSMGGTQADNFLNTFGNGNILVWKRKAEKYLVDSGLNYTIVHPGGLLNDKGGERELILDVDDKLINEQPSQSKYRSIPREDVAELCVQALLLKEADNRAIDVVSKPPGEGSPTTDFAKLLTDMPHNCDYSDMEPAKKLAEA